MLKWLVKQNKNEKGLTLVEVLAVIVILAIVAAIAIPAVGNLIENSRYNAVKADGLNVLSAANLYFVENPKQSEVTVEDLKSEGYLDSAGKIPTTSASIVKKAIPNELTTDRFVYSGKKEVHFNNASINEIANDNQKGSTLEAATGTGGVIPFGGG